MHEQACCHDEAVNHQLPIATALHHLNSFHEGMFKLNAIFDAYFYWPTRSVILNAMDTQYTCSLNGIYLPH